MQETFPNFILTHYFLSKNTHKVWYQTNALYVHLILFQDEQGHWYALVDNYSNGNFMISSIYPCMHAETTHQYYLEAT